MSTDIPLRDERIREHLFETKRFAEAEITAQLDLAPIVELADGVQLEMRQPVTVSLHGKRKSYASDLLVTRLDEHRFQVVTCRRWCWTPPTSTSPPASRPCASWPAPAASGSRCRSAPC